MRKYLLFLPLFLIGLFLLAGCGRDCPNEPETEIVPLHVHLQSGFDNDLVRVEIDGRVEYEKRISTNNVLGLAESFAADKPVGEHTIRVTVNDMSQGAKTFTLDKELYIGVSYGVEYERPNSFGFLLQEEPFLYD